MAADEEWDHQRILAEIRAALRAFEELGAPHELLSAARWLTILIEFHVKHSPRAPIHQGFKAGPDPLGRIRADAQFGPPKHRDPGPRARDPWFSRR